MNKDRVESINEKESKVNHPSEYDNLAHGHQIAGVWGKTCAQTPELRARVSWCRRPEVFKQTVTGESRQAILKIE